jgi:predicted  nucleic acid-binding Zn-ribbon protein
MDDNIRKETALKELKYKIAEVESEIRTQVDIYDELRANIRKEKEESQKLIKEMEVGMEKADQKVIALRRKRDTLVGALRIMEEVTK